MLQSWTPKTIWGNIVVHGGRHRKDAHLSSRWIDERLVGVKHDVELIQLNVLGTLKVVD